MGNKRVFFALWPDDRQRDRLRDIITPVAKTVEGQAVDRRNWHITLAYVGDYPEDQVPELLERAGRVQFEPFRLSFDRMEFRPRAKVAWLAAATVPPELEGLVADLHRILQDVGVPPPDRTYRPHITLVRNARTFTTERLAQRAVSEWSSFELMESIRSAGRVTYRPLKQ
ncbi:MAG: RNA 2',3'-cyclic phosphodiesterase [Woeseiaceae bacterium]|nr:RNA 2',3'-cyclic phosphodiesterase [Woeseiaceae bacterium]